jgi:hypothetical protein
VTILRLHASVPTGTSVKRFDLAFLVLQTR